jgi:type IV secretory pathway TraG/TraD family ATPase VirD4
VGWLGYPDNLVEIAEWLRWAKKTLSRVAQHSEDNQERKKVVVYLDEVPETHFVDCPEEP